ncbi:MAG TPA: HgcAB-associated protein [Candidatus Anoxymicrobiaceae bacterium]|jgi:antitoxin PrlF
MARKQEACCPPETDVTASKVASVLSIDERGQMVLPKDLRKRAGIGPGDKLAVVTHERDGEVCCLTLIKVDSLTEMVKGVLGPLMKDIIPELGE